ncbi:MAG: reverse transcriptase domain-containing protein [Myxococcota bacterium]|jgi:retron-type reverse transcriptase|nr:reverse transcriptase domain-containing protein [Myxococcota bacterium]
MASTDKDGRPSKQGVAEQSESTLQLWARIEQAGSIENHIRQELATRGLAVTRKPTEGMNKAELERYKKALKAEAAEKRKLAKEAWQAYRATHFVHLGEGVFWNDLIDFDKWDLDDAENRAAENELPRLDKPIQLSKALGIELGQLRQLVYHRDAARKLNYRRFTIPKRDGSARAIWAPLPRLKAAQRWVLREILEHLPVHGAAHAFLIRRSIASNAAVHSNAKMLLELDLKDFFPTVSYRRVKGIFRKAGYREQLSSLLALLCTEAPREVVEHDGKRYFVALGARCLPQGAPTSPALTNVICMRLDRRLAGLASKLGWRYTRYADDLTFSLPIKHKGKPQLGKLLGSVMRIVRDEGFQPHPKKTHVSRKGDRQKVTGLIINAPKGPRCERKLKRMLRSAVHNLEHGAELRPGESLNTLIGYAAYVAMTEPELGKAYLARLEALRERFS